ncbi:TIGR02391 family protein [Streptacidiphilus carbonis]|uniref:TIGR02391 family protein n=1 Tax=Streptacidiphilus carbonis TaxID=105422 RepID=UPI00126A2715|nr:TIGR02391 family protein [Streptacidiphilus carbonis]
MMLEMQNQAILDLIYGLVYPEGAWPTYRTVDLHMDKSLGISDTQAALLSIPAQLLLQPWQRAGFNDSDELRLTLRGVDAAEGGRQDLDALAAFLAWTCEREQVASVDAADFAVTGREYAEALGLDLGPLPDPQDPLAPAPGPVSADAKSARELMTRIRVLGMLMHSFWQSAGYSPAGPWDWTFFIDRRRLRRYRGARTGADLLELEDQFQGDATPSPIQPPTVEAESLVDVSTAVTDTMGSEDAVVVLHRRPHEAMMAVLRDDIIELCTVAVSQNRYDDAIFEAFRHVETTVQRRTGLNDTIGGLLLQQAFRDEPYRIRVSERKMDQQRLHDMFSAAIGLHRGDRAHKNKPNLVCRTLPECVRILAHACVLLDLLDRDMAVTPAIRGYAQHDDDTLTLRVVRATPTTRVLIDEQPCRVLRRTAETITVSTAGIPTDEHDVVLIDGSLQSPSKPIWLVRGAGKENWYRVEEVDIPLFSDPECSLPLDATGIRLATRESGVRGQRLVATRNSYTPGDYVTWRWDTSIHLPKAWARGRSNEPPFVAFNSSTLFNGDPKAAAHPARTMKVSLEPPLIKARVGEAPPIRALVWKTDGTATWTEAIDNPTIRTDDAKTVSYERQGPRVLAPGRCTLRLEHDSQYAEAVVEAVAHPRGTVTDWVTALPPVSDLVFTKNKGVLLATREATVWHIDAKTGKLGPAAGAQLQPPMYGGVDRLAPAPNGDVALQLYGEPDLLVLTGNSDLSCSYTVTKPEPENTITAFAWLGTDLIIAMHSRTLWRYTPDGQHTLLGQSPNPIKRLTPEPNTGKLLALTGHGQEQQICRLDPRSTDTPEDLLTEPQRSNTLGSLAATPDGEVYVTDFYGGRLLRLDSGVLTTVASGLKNPDAVCIDDIGTVYVADFADHASVRRLLP